MAEGLRKQLHLIGRFYALLLPHRKLALVAIFTMVLYSVTAGGAVMLMKPIFQGLVRPERAASKSPAEPAAASANGATGAKQKPPMPPVIAKIGEGLKLWLTGIPPVRWLIEWVAPGPNQLRNVALLVVFLLAPLWAISSFFESYASGQVVWNVMADLRVTVFEKLSHMPLAFFSSRKSGDLISRLTNDISASQALARLVFEDLLLQPMKITALLIAALWASWKLTLVILVTVPILGFVLRYYGRRIHKYGRRTLEKVADVTESIHQMFSGIRVMKAFGMEDAEQEEFRERSRQQVQKASKLVKNKAYADSIPQFVLATALGLVLLLGHHFQVLKVVEVERVGCLAFAVFLMIGPIKRTVKCYGMVRSNVGALERVFELLDEEVALQDAPDAKELRDVSEGIRFNHLWFAYSGEDYVLKDVDFSVPKGTICAIVGEVGSGKSTLLDLVPRFYDAARGSVEIDGVDVRRTKRTSLLKHIAIVAQHPFLFNRSIIENIRYGRRDATDEQVMQAAKAAHIHDFIAKLPEGYNTIVGERGARLSGGQRQCVTIARALLKNAPILILDEATSNLDSESERMVQIALGSLMKGRTTFVIAHRLSTIRFADMIVVLKRGRLVELGTHQELLARGDEYAKLYRLQFSETGRGAGPAEDSRAKEATVHSASNEGDDI